MRGDPTGGSRRRLSTAGYGPPRIGFWTRQVRNTTRPSPSAHGPGSEVGKKVHCPGDSYRYRGRGGTSTPLPSASKRPLRNTSARGTTGSETAPDKSRNETQGYGGRTASRDATFKVASRELVRRETRYREPTPEIRGQESGWWWADSLVVRACARGGLRSTPLHAPESSPQPLLHQNRVPRPCS